MLSRTILVGAAAAALVGAPGVAAADPNEPPAPPPPPNVNGYAPVKPSEFAVLGDSRLRVHHARRADVHGAALRADTAAAARFPAPRKARTWSAERWAACRSSPTSAANPFASAARSNRFRPTRGISFQTLSCGTDGALTTCVDSKNQAGFVIAPAGSWIVGEVNPLVDRPEGTNPYFN